MEEEQDGDDVFVDSSDTLLLGSQAKGTKLRVLRHSDGGTSPLPEVATVSSEDVSQKSVDSSSTAAIEDALKSEQEFLEYVLTAMPSVADKMVHKTSTVSEPSYCVAGRESSPMRKSSSRTAVKGNSKVGLDHLDNLCKLMEQLSELREANTKLQRRVQYLEDVKTLHELTREINEVNDAVSQPLEVSLNEMNDLDKTEKPEEVQEEKYSSKRNQSDRRHHGGGLYKSKTSPAIGQERLRERSKSVGHEMVDSKSGKKRFPKWSRVKEALGWERTTPTNYADRRQSERQRSSPRQAQRQLRVARGGSKSQSCKEYRSSEPLIGQEPLLPASSSEDLRELPADRLRLGTKRHTSSNIRRSLQAPIQDTRRRKSTPSPTTLAQEALKQEMRLGQELRLRCETLESGMDPEQALAKLKKANKGPWGRVKTIIQTRRDSLKRKQSSHRKVEEVPIRAERASSAISVEISLASEGEGDSCSYDQDTQSLISDTKTEYDQRSSSRNYDHSKEDSGSVDFVEDEGSLMALTSSPTMRRKSRWTKMKRVFGGSVKRDDNCSRSVPSSPISRPDGTGTAFDFENIPDDEDDIHEADSPVGNSNQSSGNAASSSEGERPVPPLTLMPCGSAPVATLVHELQSNLSEDFNKKILEWERMKSSASVRNPNKSSFKNVPHVTTLTSSGASTATAHEHKQKSEKDKLQKGEKTSKQRVKDLSWLQKEIEKVEKEKERLAKERKKYEDKAQRLENLRKTVLDAKTTNKNEVLVKTSAGEFRFEGISDDFTKKLYEWETKKGVGPELSTIALLDSSRHGLRVNEKGKLQKGLSHSDTSLNDVSGGHSLSPPAQTSCTSLPSLMKESNLCVPPERLHSSRANSEPDLFSSSAKEPSPSIKSECDDKSTIISVPSADENYLALLEKNATLLEELKKEEAFCQGLESELQTAEEKVNDMSWKLEKEMDNYRGQLWEVHRPGSQPEDLENSLKEIAQRKNLVEELETKVEQLKAERDHIEGICRIRNERRAELAADLSNKIKELREAKNAVSACLQDTTQGIAEEWDRASIAEAEVEAKRASISSKDIPIIDEDNTETVNERTTEVGQSNNANRQSEENNNGSNNNYNRKWQTVKKSSTASFSEHGADSEDERRRRSESRAYSEQSEFNSLMHEASASNTGCSSPMEVPDSLCSSPRGNFPPQITVRRSSAGNVSSVSGPECSESSSLNEAVSFALRLPNRRWRATSSSSSSDNDDNYSTSSDSSFLEDIPTNRKSWSRHRLARQERTTEAPSPREDETGCTYYIPITEEKDDGASEPKKPVEGAEESTATSEDVTPKISNASQNQFILDEGIEEEPKFRRPNFDFFLEDEMATPTVQMDRNWQFQTLSEPEPIATCYTEMESVPPASISPVRFEILPQSQSATSTTDEMVPPLLPRTHPKYFFEPFTSLTDLAKSEKLETPQPKFAEDLEVSVKPKPLASFSSLKLSADSPVIKSRSPRRLKSDKDRNSLCLVETSPTQEPAKPVFNMNGSKYWPKVPAAPTETPVKYQRPIDVPVTHEETFVKYNPTKEDIGSGGVKYHPIELPPLTSQEALTGLPSTTCNIKREQRITTDSRARIQAQIKAKEELLRNYELDKIQAQIEEKLEPKTIIHKIELEDTKPEVTDVPKPILVDRKCATLDRRTQEPPREITRSSSRGFLQGKMKKLQKSKQSGSTSAVGALCRQSMFLAIDNPSIEDPPTVNLPQKSSSQSAIGAKSCPSSPETKPKSRGWFPKNIFKR